MSLSKQQEFRETRRLNALQLLKSGKNQTQVATELGVSPAAVSQWVKAARLGGKAALEAKPFSGRPKKLSDAQLQRLARMLSEGPSKHGFPTELWTLQRVAVLVRRKFGVTYDQSGIWHVLRRLNWTQQKPERQARERDEKVVQAWRSREWPRIKKLAS
jgi:transposase